MGTNTVIELWRCGALFMSLTGKSGKWGHNVLNMSVRPSVSNFVNMIFKKTNEPKVTRGQRHIWRPGGDIVVLDALGSRSAFLVLSLARQL